MKKLLITAVFINLLAVCAFSQTTAFSHQGKLNVSGAPANGNYDFEFKLFDAASGGAQQGGGVQRLNVAVVNGIYAVSLDFGATALTGADRYLDIAVRTAGGGSFTPLTPRQQVTSAPYAVKSLNADNLGGVPANQYVTTTTGGSNFIQNTTSQQASSNFNISGNGTVGGVISGNVVDVTTHYQINGSRVLAAGSTNIFAGQLSGQNTTSGISNSFFGFQSGTANTTGFSNVFVGRDSGAQNTTGSENTYLGTSTSFTNSTGSGNTMIGYAAGAGNGINNAIAIGNRAMVATSNSLVLGAVNGSNGATWNTNVGIGTITPSYKLHVVGQNLRIEGNSTAVNPRFSLNFTGGGFDQKKWQNYATTNQLVFSALNDAESLETQWMQVNRGLGTSISRVVFPQGQVRLESTFVPGLSFNETVGSTTDQRKWVIEASAGRLFFGARNDAENGTINFMSANRGPGFSVSNVIFGTNVAIGLSSSPDMLAVGGNVSLLLGSAGSTQVCQNAVNQLSTCSSSLRYKTNVSRFSQGMSFIDRLRPISFEWKDSGLKDVGFGAEDIAKIDPRFVTYNDKGEVEGVKYDRLSVAFVNAFKEQQAEISGLRAVSSEQAKKIEDQQKQIDALKELICSQNPTAAVCKK